MADINLALNQRQAPAAVDTGGAVPVTGGVVGQVANPDLGITQVQERPGARLLDGLMKVGADLIKPALKRQQDAAFFNGMARAAAGEAAKDIAAESPAWSNFFGEGAGALGARAYEGARDAARIEGEAVANLSTDRQVAPETYAESLRQRLDGMKSGDPLRDQQMQAAAFQMLPNLMKVHAQAHVQFNQERAFQARGEAVTSAIDAMESWSSAARNSDVPVSNSDRERAGQALEMALAPIPGEDIRIADKAKIAAIQAALADGKFAAYERLWESGAINSLPVEQRDQLTNVYRVNANRVLPSRVKPETRDEATAVRLNPPVGIAALDEVVNRINSRASLESGILGADFIDAAERERLHLQAGNRLRTEQAAAARRAMSAAEAAAKEAALRGGALAALTDSRGVQGVASTWASVQGEGGSRALSQVGTELWASTPDPKARASMLVNLGTSNTLDAAKSEFATAANSTDWNPQVGTAWATLKGLPAEVMGAYGVTNDQQFLFEQAELYAKGGLAPQEAWKVARGTLATRPFRDPNLSKEEREAAEGVAKGFNTSPWGRDRTDSQGFALLEGMIGAGMRSSPGGAPESRALAARGSVTARGGEIVGNVFFFRNDKGLERWRDTLNDGNGAGEDQVAEAFHAVWERKLKLNSGLNDQVTWPMGKLKPTLPWVIMNKDQRGDFYWSSVYHEPDADGLQGRMHSVTITKRDIEGALRKSSRALDPKGFTVNVAPIPASQAGEFSVGP